MHLLRVSIKDATWYEIGEHILAAQLWNATPVHETADYRVPAGSTRRLARRRLCC
jgi:hypothetical protein